MAKSSPTVAELPVPPSGKTGWPWVKAVESLPETMRDERVWPKVSVVTPSYNQAAFLEETIRSVLLQGYPNLEYIIIDGGSVDGSLEIIQKYEPWLTYWISEKDHGQSQAINKGFRRMSGEFAAYINSDDVYAPGAIYDAVSTFLDFPGIGGCYGRCPIIDEHSKIVDEYCTQDYSFEHLWLRNYLPQPATFIRTDALRQVGWLDENFHYLMDYDLWLRFGLKGYNFFASDKVFASFRKSPYSKTTTQAEGFLREQVALFSRYLKPGSIPTSYNVYPQRGYARACMALSAYYFLQGLPERADEYFDLAVQNGVLETDYYYVAELLMQPSRSAGAQAMFDVIERYGKRGERLHHACLVENLATNAYLTYVGKDSRRFMTYTVQLIRHDPAGFLRNKGQLSRLFSVLCGYRKLNTRD